MKITSREINDGSRTITYVAYGEAFQVIERECYDPDNADCMKFDVYTWDYEQYQYNWDGATTNLKDALNWYR